MSKLSPLVFSDFQSSQPMDLYDNRLATFKSKNLDGSKKKVWPAKFKNNRPFTAEYLAKIGFIHTPTKSRADCLTCSVCNTECNWSETHEHPLSFHLDHSPCWNSRIWGAGAVSRQIIDERNLEMSLAELKELLMKSFTESKTKWVFPLKSKKHPNEQDVIFFNAVG